MTRDEQERCGNCYGTDPERCVVCLRRQRDEAIAERDALRAALNRGNANMEEMERYLYLRLQAVEDERDALKERVSELEAKVRSLQTCDREAML